MNKFDTETTTLNALTRRKRPDCVSALTELFHSARKEGLGLREAYWYAETTHFLRDHEGHLHGPELDFEQTDEAARQVIINELMARNSDGLAEDRVDLAITWYERFRSWGAGVALAFSNAAKAGQEEWESTHDLPESDAVKKIHEAASGNDPATVEIRELLLKIFYGARRAGETVYASLDIARQEAEELLMLRALLAGTGIGPIDANILGSKGGYVN
jgi:hypothetical protein